MMQLPKLDEHDSVPVYIQLSDHIKREIFRGELVEHNLPSFCTKMGRTAGHKHNTSGSGLPAAYCGRVRV